MKQKILDPCWPQSRNAPFIHCCLNHLSIKPSDPIPLTCMSKNSGQIFFEEITKFLKLLGIETSYYLLSPLSLPPSPLRPHPIEATVAFAQIYDHVLYIVPVIQTLCNGACSPFTRHVILTVFFYEAQSNFFNPIFSGKLKKKNFTMLLCLTT